MSGFQYTPKQLTLAEISAGIVAGSNTQVQFNDGGVFGADAAFVFDKSVGKLQSTYFQVGTAYHIKTLSNNNEVAIGGAAGDSATGTNGMTALGLDAGGFSTNISFSLLIGSAAGMGASYSSTNDFNSIFIGASAGNASEDCDSSIFLGNAAGGGATYSGAGPLNFQSIFIGGGSGASSVDAYGCVYIGGSSGQSSSGYRNTGLGSNCFGSSSVITSVGIGQYSFEQCTSGNDNLGFGDYTFNYASNPQEGVAVGVSAGSYSTDLSATVLIGKNAGAYSTTLFQSVLIGKDAAINSTNVSNSLGIGERVFEAANTAVGCVAIGSTTCYGILNTSSAIGIGNSAASTEFGGAIINNAIMIGQQAGWESYNASRVIAIGLQSCYFDTVDNNTSGGWNILLGDYTGTGGFQNSIAIGVGALNSATAQANIGNVIYIDGIKTSSTPDAASETAAHVGFGTNTPTAQLDVEGDFKLGVGGSVLTSVLAATATLDFPSTSTYSDLTVTVTGAAVGDVVSIGVPNSCIFSHTCYFGWVSAADTVTVRFLVVSSGPHNPPSASFKVLVTKF